MKPQADAVAFDPFGAALALGNDLVFLEELLRRLGEAFLGLEEAGAGLAAHLKEPVLGELLRLGQTFFLGGGATLTASDGSRAMPMLAAAFVDLNQATENLVRRHRNLPSTAF